MQPKDYIIAALDTDKTKQAAEWAHALAGHVGGFKIGLEFITSLLVRMMSMGLPEAQKELLAARDLFDFIDEDLFWDGKWHDTPNTIGGAAEALIKTQPPRYFTVHASAGIATIEAAAEKKRASKLLVVTVLTSLSNADTRLIYGASSEKKVIQFAHEACSVGADGLICSPQEIEMLRQKPEFNDLLLITPGIRPTWAETGDQKRTMTPGEAVKAGANGLVIGRSITRPSKGISSPLDAVNLITEEIARALA